MAQVVVDDAKVISMLANAKFRKEFPFLGQIQAEAETKAKQQQAKIQAASAEGKSCKPCNRKTKTVQTNYAKIRRRIGQMPNDQKLKLKQMLNADQIVVTYTNKQGKTIRLKF